MRVADLSPSRPTGWHGLRFAVFWLSARRMLLMAPTLRRAVPPVPAPPPRPAVRIYSLNGGHSRDVYHTKRMQRVFAVRFSGDGSYVFSGGPAAGGGAARPAHPACLARPPRGWDPAVLPLNSLRARPWLPNPTRPPSLQPSSPARGLTPAAACRPCLPPGSDDMNVRVWKAEASEQLGTLLPRERKKHAYNKALVGAAPCGPPSCRGSAGSAMHQTCDGSAPAGTSASSGPGCSRPVPPQDASVTSTHPVQRWLSSSAAACACPSLCRPAGPAVPAPAGGAAQAPSRGGTHRAAPPPAGPHLQGGQAAAHADRLGAAQDAAPHRAQVGGAGPRAHSL